MFHFSNLFYRNGVRLPNGKVPTKGEVAANATLAAATASGPSDLSTQVDAATQEFYTYSWMKLMSEDLYKAHAVLYTFTIIISHEYHPLNSNLLFYIRKHLRKATMTGQSGAGCTTRWV